jgi:uroporphyrinogen III methyltransferase/synthase
LGKVYLVGAGPGDEGLITVRGLELIKQADIILYDRLSNDRLLTQAGEKTELIYVGKKAGDHSYTQEEINQLLVTKAEQGKQVVRLKGGDPFVFGRGGEEAAVLAEAGVEFEIVPGITSAVSVPAYAGIPVTHRDFSSSVAFVTGHQAATKEESSVNWKQLASGVETLVILMGVGNLAKIADKLTAAGRTPETPVALVRWGTRSEQEVISGTLDNIAAKVRAADFKPPAVIIVGEVVKLKDKLDWFSVGPLAGKNIVVTRPPKQAASFCQLLAEKGANPLKAPAIEIKPPASYDQLDESLQQVGSYDWIIFTSVNGVRYTLERLFELDQDARALGEVKLGAIGAKTAARLKNYGLQADYVPEEYVSEAVVEGFSSQDLTGQKFLLPRANIARPALQDGLAKLGAQVDNVTAYQTIAGAGSEQIRDKLTAGEVDVVTFTSSSTVRNFLAGLGDDYQELLQGVKIACIGPITAGTAREQGLNVEIVAEEYTIEGLMAAMEEHYIN